MWREVEVVGVGDVASLFSARAFVWGDVDPHVGGLGAGRANLKCETKFRVEHCRLRFYGKRISPLLLRARGQLG